MDAAAQGDGAPPAAPSPVEETHSHDKLLLPESASELSAGGPYGPETVSAETQTAVATDAAVQYEAPGEGADANELASQLDFPALAAFLAVSVPLCEAALQQNELADAMADELAALVDEEGGEAGAGAASRSTTTGLAEHFTFSDLVHSKGRTLSAVAWHPARRGVVAVACTQQHAQQQRGEGQGDAGGGAAHGTAAQAQQAVVGRREAAGGAPAGAAAAAAVAASAAHTSTSGAAVSLRQPPPGCILVWSHADAIHPELVLQPPAEALAFAFHPTAPHTWLAAGLATGQVALFNLQQAGAGAGAAAGLGAPSPAHPHGSAAGAKQPQQPQRSGSLLPDDGREDASRATLLLPTFVSSPEACHQAAVTDLQWLPGTAVTKDGRLEAVPASGVVEGAGAGTAAAPAADSCILFATTSADGSLLVWDMRISTRHRKAAKEEEAPDWKPVLALPAATHPLLATRFCPDLRAGVGRFLLGALEGELAVVEVAPSFQEQKAVGSMFSEWALNTLQQCVGHTGRVVALSFSPFFSDTLLAVGDSGFVVWRVAIGSGSSSNEAAADGGTGSSGNGSGSGSGSAGSAVRCLAVYESPFSAEAMYTCGCWSPSKPGVVLVGRADGRLEAWDLLDRSHQAAMVAPVAPCALTALAASPMTAPAAAAGGRAQPQLLAVGDAGGTLRLLELPRVLRRRGHAEVRAMSALLAREQDRLMEATRRAEARAAQARAAVDRQRAAAAAAAQGAARRQEAAATAAKATDGEEEGEEDAAEQRYLALEAEWRARLLGGGGEEAVLPAAG